MTITFSKLPHRPPMLPRDDGDLLQAVREIAARLAATATADAWGPGWDSDELVGDDPATARVVRHPPQADLYGGRAGIGLMLACAGVALRDPGALSLGLHAVEAALGQDQAMAVGPAPGGAASLSLFSGSAGVALAARQAARAASHAGTAGRPQQVAGLWSTRQHSDLALRVAQHAEALADGLADKLIADPRAAIGEQTLDFIGSAGAMLLWADPHLPLSPRRRAAIRALVGQIGEQAREVSWPTSARATPFSRTESGARRGTTLGARAGSVPRACCWPQRPGEAGLCGMAHGAAGVAYVLEAAGGALGPHDSRGRQALELARAARRYERSCFDASTANWPDLRGDGRGRMVAWCHGSIGVGAHRCSSHARNGSLDDLAELSVALDGARGVVRDAAAAQARGQRVDGTLCHGLAGAVDLFVLAGQATGRPEHQQAARRSASLLLSMRDSEGDWVWGLAGATWVPGLMAGLAGIGASLLRVARPEAMGSPLLAGFELAMDPGATSRSPRPTRQPMLSWVKDHPSGSA